MVKNFRFPNRKFVNRTERLITFASERYNKTFELNKTAARRPVAENRRLNAEDETKNAEAKATNVENKEPNAKAKEINAENNKPNAETKQTNAENKEANAETRETYDENNEPNAEGGETNRQPSLLINLNKNSKPWQNQQKDP